MNACIVSLEQQAGPELRGRPIAVFGGGVRTVITGSSRVSRYIYPRVTSQRCVDELKQT
jgi:hypothetical protein